MEYCPRKLDRTYKEPEGRQEWKMKDMTDRCAYLRSIGEEGNYSCGDCLYRKVQLGIRISSDMPSIRTP